MSSSHRDLLQLGYELLDKAAGEPPESFGTLRQARRHKGKIVIIADNYVIKSHSAGHPAALLLAHEEHILRRIQGPPVSELVAAGKVEGRTILILKRAPGRDLWSGFVPATEVPKIADQMRAILSALHSQGICHNDIRPHNFLWDTASARLTLIDFEYASDASQTGPQALAQHFTSQAANHAERDYLETQLRDLGGKWRSELGTGSCENDRLAADKIIRQLSNRTLYWRLRAIFAWEQAVVMLKRLLRKA